MNDLVKFEDLIGCTITKIDINADKDVVHFYCDDGFELVMKHFQECCEQVSIDQIDGDLEDILHSTVLEASERTSDSDPDDYEPNEYRDDSCTWTFYHIATIKGWVTIRWYGESNGYYSESVHCINPNMK